MEFFAAWPAVGSFEIDVRGHFLQPLPLASFSDLEDNDNKCPTTMSTKLTPFENALVGAGGGFAPVASRPLWAAIHHHSSSPLLLSVCFLLSGGDRSLHQPAMELSQEPRYFSASPIPRTKLHSASRPQCFVLFAQVQQGIPVVRQFLCVLTTTLFVC